MLRQRPPLASSLAGVVLFAVTACAPAARSAPIALAPIPEEVEEVEPEDLGEGPDIDEAEVTDADIGLLGTVAYDLPVEANSWVEAELNFLVGERSTVIGRWLERGDFYEPFIKSVLASNGMPTDLYHLAMIESGFIPNARSRAGAVGLWQFMPATARMEGLRVDNVVDERIDPVRSTRAAVRHLRMLHRNFGGDWALAAAAYNAGSGRISRGMQGFGARNFWELAVWGDLADETKHYVPRLYAMTIIARDRPRFGFAPPPEWREGFAFDSIRVDLATPLAELAGIGGVPEAELARLNPHLLQRVTPSGNYTVWVPAGRGPSVQQAFLDSDFRRNGGYATYVVRRGDNLSKLAQQSGLSSARIRELNPRTNWERLPIGHRLRMPAPAVRALNGRGGGSETTVAAAAPRSGGSANGSSASRGSSRPAPAASGTRVTEHRVKPGETLWSIARQYGVSVDELQAANRLNGAKIVAGRTLKVPQRASAGTQRASTSQSAQHVVKPGETLWSIARAYGSSVDAIQGANRMKNSVIVPGQRLLIPR
jgi:membrane-bound lytic murein transglycosylase D